MIKDSPNPPSGSAAFDTAAHRAINHYLNPPEKPEPSTEDHSLFTVRKALDVETLLVNASEDLASVQALASHLAFEIEGTPRKVALGICRMLERIGLLVYTVQQQYEVQVAQQSKRQSKGVHQYFTNRCTLVSILRKNTSTVADIQTRTSALTFTLIYLRLRCLVSLAFATIDTNATADSTDCVESIY